MSTMSNRILGTILVALLTITGAGSAAAKSAPHCKVLSISSQAQTRAVSGMTAAATTYGPVRKVGSAYVRTVTTYTYSGNETRTVTTTTERCRGKVSQVTSETPWSGAKIVATTTTQRVR